MCNCGHYFSIKLVRYYNLTAVKYQVIVFVFQIVPNDFFPELVCKECFLKAHESYTFRIQCENAEKRFLQELEEADDTFLKDSE